MEQSTPKTNDLDQPILLPKVYKDVDQMSRAFDFVSEQLKRCWQDHENRSHKWLEWNNAYRLIDEQKPDEGASVVDPEPQIEVDTLTANITEAFLGQDPPFKFQGMEESDEEQASIMTSYVADGLRRIQIRDSFERTIRQGLIYGTMIIKTPYKKEWTTRKVKRREPAGINNDGTIKYVTKVSSVKFPKIDDTDWQYVSMFDFYPVGRGKTIEQLDGVIQFFERSYDELLTQKQTSEKMEGSEVERMNGIYNNLDMILPSDPTKKLSVCEYWGKIPLSVATGNEEDKTETFEGVITCVMNRKDFGKTMLRENNSDRTGEMTNYEEPRSSEEGAIRFQENPFWDGERPYLSCPYTPVDDEFYGIGIIEPMIEKWYELNTTIRQVLDNKTLQLLNPTIEDVNANVQRNIRLTKNPRIKAEDINGVKVWPIQDFSANGYNAIAAIKDDMRKGSGAVESVQGVSMSKDTSATEFAGVAQQAGIRIKNKIKLIDENLFKPFLDRSYKYAQQFAGEERIVRVLGKNGASWVKVAPEQVYGTLDIVTQGPTQIENSVVQANKLIQYLGIAARAPQFANIPYLLGDIWVKMGFPESDRNKVILGGNDEEQNDIEQEIVALSMGQRVMVKPNSNHQMHLAMKIQAFDKLRNEGKVTEAVEAAFRENIDRHAEFMEAQQANGGRLGAAMPTAPSPVDGMETPNPMGAPSSESGAVAA